MRYLTLLKQERNFRLLSLVQLICYFGVWFSHTGIFTLLISLDAPIWAITLSAAMAYIPGVVLAPFSGVWVDKFSAKPMLIIIALIETVTVFMLVFINSLDLLWLLLVLIFIRNGTGGIYFQVEMSLFPKILSKENLKLANEIHSIIWAVAYTAGMGMAGVYIHFFGIKSAFILDGVIYIISFYFLFALKIPNFKPKFVEPTFKMLQSGLIYLKQNKLVIHLILLHSIVGVTAYDALVALLADYTYANILSISLVIGLINTCRAVSLMISPIILGKFANKKTLLYFYIGHGIGIIIWAILQSNFYLGFLGLLAAGFFTSTLWSYTYTLLQQNCDAKFYGRVIAYNDMVYLGISALVSVAIGLLFRLGVGLEIITALMGMVFFAGAFYYHKISKFYDIK
ncbi:MFS transporter [Campylobacter sp. RM12920]|uniref:MFS transporter n=1 Tax=Campylobacter californiensis TaxID=1032243 RepID=A0ABD4JIH3_9BACT|nr:MFS transporter [Campylobacter sp. RM12919]MBE2987725.1 MFS transporter [Campylobacter sp. RM12920]